MSVKQAADESVAILLVDDKPNNLVALESFLACGDYRIVMATSAAEALAHLQQGEFAVILTDVMMPVMDGFEFATLVKQDHRLQEIPIIFLTAMDVGKADIFRGYEVGAVDYIQKPLDPAVVKAKVDVFAQLFRQKRLIKRINSDLERRVELRTKEIRRRESQLVAITDALPVLVAQVDANEKFLFVNQAFRQMSGISHHEFMGMTLQEMLGSDQYRLMKRYIMQALAGRNVVFEHQQTDSKGATLSYKVSLIPEHEEQKGVSGFIIVATDITEHKRIEEDLRLAKQSADAANAAKSAFLANMSHEIRTPLGAVLGFAELILSPCSTEAERLGYMASVKRNGDLLSNIINDILDLSKVEAGKMETEKKDVPLDEVLTDITTLLKLHAEEKGIDLRLVRGQPLPATIQTDPLRLRQILLNIVGNAIKFTARGSVEVKIQYRAAEGGAHGKLAFAVTDTGPGISVSQAVRLFESFTQADVSTKRKHGGTGLGLVLSRRLANILGGDVTLDRSALGQGSTFTVTIDPGPVGITTEVAPRSTVSTEAAAAKKSSDIRLDGVNVLLVDDAADNRLIVGRFLRMAGAIVDTAENGREAVKKVQLNVYHAVLMDLQMPEMDGYEATAALRRDGRSLPIIAFTAHALNGERQRCLDAGFDDHICKPVDRRQLLEQLARFTTLAG